MFCSQCGSRAEGRFCSQCGAALTRVPAARPAPPQTLDWSNEVRYDVLIQLPEVRERIRRQSSLASRRLSGEELLGLYDKIVSPAVPLEKIAAVVQPIYAALGIGTGKRRTEVVSASPGRVMVRSLCSLARHGQELRAVRQAEDGCLLEARLPSDLWSLEGDLLVTVRRHATGTEVEAVTKIKGQLFDWGKSRRCLEQLYTDLQADAA